MNNSVKTITQMAMGCVVLVICSWCSVPLAVPATLQLLGLFVLVGLFGTKKTLGSLGAYLLLGALGLPVFAGFGGGVGAFVGPTAGFLVGLIPLTLFCGWLYPKAKSLWAKGLVFGLGLVFPYTLGTVWYGYGFAQGEGKFLSAMMVCVVPFLLPDICKILVSVWILKRLDGKGYATLV